ncbi:MAG: purine-nucleoside phosphorylase [Pirellulaceae bacterium]|nr:purine-nucleoside phosphorylase [Planctomycetales bacterium]
MAARLLGGWQETETQVEAQDDWQSQINSATVAIRSLWNGQPRVGIILGTGLGDFAQHIERDVEVDYERIPHFPRTTATGHRGQLICGHVAGIGVVTMEGRYHLYEGYSPAEVTFPIRVMKEMGIEILIVSNASGGLNPIYRTGEIMVLDDHIDFTFRNPLRGLADARLARRFPDRSHPYDPQLVEWARQVGRKQDFAVHRGVYVGLLGPNYETRAEYRLLRKLGADVVGMSTVTEVIVAVHLGLRVLALSAVTNVCRPDSLSPTCGADVIAAAKTAEPKMRRIALGVLRKLAEDRSS